jgi:hypothetical protein
MNLRSDKLYRVLSIQVVAPDYGPLLTLEPGTILWMHGSRPSTLGGYIGTFSTTYTQMNGFSPNHDRFQLKTEHVEPIDT